MLTPWKTASGLAGREAEGAKGTWAIYTLIGAGTHAAAAHSI